MIKRIRFFKKLTLYLCCYKTVFIQLYEHHLAYSVNIQMVRPRSVTDLAPDHDLNSCKTKAYNIK